MDAVDVIIKDTSEILIAPTPMSRQKRPLDPILIGSFPSPPTHIPPTPTTPNPPPSRPPSAPLPPVPGPSRISGHDTLGANRSRFSISSHDGSRPISTASPSRMSTGSRPPSAASPPRSPTSLSYNTPSIAFSIHAHDELTVEDLTRMSISPMPPLSDNDEDEEVMRFTHSPKSNSFARTHQANESISSIDMGHLMLNDDDDDEQHDGMTDIPVVRPRPGTFKHRPNEPSLADPIDPQTLHLQFRASRSTSESHKQMLRSRSKSKLEMEASQPPKTGLPPLPSSKAPPTTPTSPDRPSSPDITTILSKTPRPTRRGSSSRPSTSMSVHDHSSSRLASDRPRVDSLPDPRSRATSLTKSTPAVQRRASEGIVSNASTLDSQMRKLRRSDPTIELPHLHPRQSGPDDGGDDDDDARSWIEHDEFGWPVDGGGAFGTDGDRTSFGMDNEDDRHGGMYDTRRKVIERERRVRDLEKQLEGGGSDSDSSLDLHTPLPHLMLRHGLLSPHSKLLPQSQEGGPRPDSVVSLVSNRSTTTNGLSKDTRDTPMRRTRHRDGRLLRGGIGLTTGLGWSDSEDEDAPSPLTRRISSLNLSRNNSVSSMHSSYSHSDLLSYSSRPSSHVHPLARSYSSGTLAEGRRHFNDDGFGVMDEFGQYRTTSGEWSSVSPRHKKRDASHQSRTSKTLSSSSSSGSRSSLPPTAWQKRPGGKSQGGNANGRTSTSSTGSHFSLEVSIPEHEHESDEPTTVATRTPKSNKPYSSRGVYRSNSRNDDVVNTPSTASTLSIPLPITPHDDHPSPDFASTSVARKLDKEKSLPPLPPSLKRSPASSSTLGLSSRHGTQQILRPRTYSSASSSSASHKPPSSSPPPMPSTPLPNTTIKPSLMSTPRPLRLSQSNIGKRGDRPAVPVPSALYSNGGGSSYSPLPSPLLNPSRSVPGGLSGGALSSNLYYSNSTSSLHSPVSPPPTPGTSPKPKPRTGTGMVYRSTSSYSSTSRMRLPSVTKSTARGVPIAL